MRHATHPCEGFEESPDYCIETQIVVTVTQIVRLLQ